MRTHVVRPLAGALVGGLLIAGCAEMKTKATLESAPASAAPADAAVRGTGGTPMYALNEEGTGLVGDTTVVRPTESNRKIIYTASVELAVEDFSGTPERVAELARRYDGYLAGSNLSGQTGESRRGTWTIRVPVERFEEFVKSAKGLGEVVRATTDSRDVSEEYFDVEARIRNKTKEEERLLALLEERPGKLEDVIAIERELSRVREELERMQGRMRVLADLTSLTTVELSIIEIRNYQPPQAPTLATQIRRTWAGSVAALAAAGKGALLAAVAVTPWLPLAAIVIATPLVVVRRKMRSLFAPGVPQQKAG